MTVDEHMDTVEGRKVVFVTGAASGIGRAAAEAFVQRGYAVVFADMNADVGKEVEAELRSIGECSFVSVRRHRRRLRP